MARSLHILKAVEMSSELLQRHASDLRQKDFQLRECQLIGSSVELNTITSRDENQLVERRSCMSTRQARQSNANNILFERQLFAQVERGSSVVESERE